MHAPYPHEKLKAYAFAVAFYRVVRDLRSQLPRGLGPLGDQLSRAAQSVCLNLAEGAAQSSINVRRRHFQIALGSANECAAALDLLEIEEAVTAETLKLARRRLKLATILTVGLAR